MPGTATFQINPQGQPPGRQAVQSHQRMRLGEGSAVVAANGTGQAVALKQALKTGAHGLASRIGHASQLQEVAAVLIPDGQGFATGSLSVIPPAFEVHRPHFIGALRPPATPKASRGCRPPSAPRLGQTCVFQYPLETAFRGRGAMPTQIQLPDLSRAPIPLAPLKPPPLHTPPFA